MKSVFTLIFALIFAACNLLYAQTANIIVNEVSQVCGDAEYIELLVYGDPVCNEIPTIDIRGWIIDDNDGGTYGTNGVASGCIRISQDPYWSNIKIGTIIMIYREVPASPCTPEYPPDFPADDIYDANNDCIHVIPFGPSTPSNLFEMHETMPKPSDPTYAPIGDAGWVNTGFNWGVIGMRNGGDVIQIINPATLTSVHAISWGDNTTSPIIYVNDGSASGNVYFMDNSVDNDPFNPLNWQTLGVADNDALEDQTPAAPNNDANQLWISSMHYGCGTIDTLKIDSIFSDPSCGNCDGSVGVNFLGGVSPFTYSWDNGNTTSNITNLCNGNFKVTVTDNNGCIDSTSVTVTSPVAFTATAATLNNESCDGANDGSVTVTTTGTVGVTTYNWSNGGSGTTQTGLADGVYTVTVTDGSGCFDIKSTTVTAGPSLNVVIANTSGQCLTGNSFTFDATGSEAPNSCGAGCPTYSWDFGDTNTQTGTAVSDLTPSHTYATDGDYTVSLTLSDGTCSSFTTITTSVFDEPTVTLTPTDILCNGANNGSVSTSVAGGTTNYSYAWSNSGATSTISNLSPNNYSVTVTDANSCTVTASTSISEPSAITIQESHTDALCNGGNDGSITITATGGVSNYQYSWSNSGNTPVVSNLSSNSYTVTITDDNGCSATESIFIDEPSAIQTSITSSNTNCNANTGQAAVNATGGTSPYTYLWSNNKTTNTITGLSSGNYSVSVYDNNNCLATNSATIVEENFVSVTIASTTNVSTPGGNDGSINITPSGGVPGYTYSWSNGATTQNNSNIAAGNYCVTVYDANLCSAVVCTSITEPGNMQITVSGVDLLCFGDNSGSISSTVTDGTSPYTYEWFSLPGNTSIGSNDNITNLSAGDYYLKVTDNTGYSINSTTVTLSQPNQITSSANISDITCNGGCNGSIFILGGGGNSPYTYEWETTATTDLINNLCEGSYAVTITDANNCTRGFSYALVEPAPLVANYIATDTFVCVGQSIQVTASPTGGTLPYPSITTDAIVWAQSGAGLTGYGPHTLSPTSTSETYSFTVYDANGCSATNQFTIKTPTALSVTIPQTISLCLGQDTKFCADGFGGSDTSNYQFVWSNGVMDFGVASSCQEVKETGTTTHRVILSDGCAPPDTAYTNIIVNPIPSISFSALNDEGCPPFSTDFEVTSSIASTTFEWDMDGDGTIDTIGSSFLYTYYESGIFDVVVTGTSPEGCSITDSIQNYIEVYPGPKVDFDLSPTETTFLNPLIKVDGSNTTGADSLLFWNFGDGTTDNGIKTRHIYEMEGTYPLALTAYNEYGCFDTDTQIVVIHPSFVIYIPNAFTPGGYSWNDYFFPKGVGIDPATYEMYIFDRWGHQVFHTKDINEYWDGTIKNTGKVGPEGVYIYKIYVSNITTGQKFQYVGHVTLLK